MKRVLNIAFWLFFSVGIVFLMSFVGSKQSSKYVSSDQLDIIVTHEGSNNFLSEEILKDRISTHFGYDIDSVPIRQIDFNALESYLTEQDEIKTVQVYRSVSGKVHLNIEERYPIVRLIHNNGRSNYYDRFGNYMPLSSEFTAHVLVVSGNLNESDNRDNIYQIRFNPERAGLLISDDVFELAEFIYRDEFWNAQIQQIVVNDDREFELIPRVGDHRILFGTTDNMKRKFRKLRVFYKEGLNNTGWNSFKTINLKFRNQVVCK